MSNEPTLLCETVWRWSRLMALSRGMPSSRVTTTCVGISLHWNLFQQIQMSPLETKVFEHPPQAL